MAGQLKYQLSDGVWVPVGIVLGAGSGGSGSSTFLDLTDVDESTFVGQAGKVPTVNTGETALEFATPASTSFDTDFAIKMSADQTIANMTTTKVNKFDTIVRDNNSEWDVANLRWACKTTGTYIINASIFWTAHTTGYRIVYIYVNGALAQSETYTGFSVATSSRITVSMALTAGQYVEIYARQNSGGNLDIIAVPGGGTAHEWQIWRIK